MAGEKFEVISVLGPLGSGKTTTLNSLIEKVPFHESYAVVVNDVGENNIDARRIWGHPANRSETIIPLTAGCIGCSDVTQFREALERVHEAGINVLFIEPTGIAPGSEIADVVESCGFDLSVLTLANARTIERDLKWQVLPSQLSVADIIGITHIPDHKNEAEVMANVLDQLPILADDVQVELIKPGDTDYFDILVRLRGLGGTLRLGGQAVADVCGHDHADGEHSHSHGVSAKSFKLQPHVSVDEIKQLLMPHVLDDDAPLLRAKGVIGNQRFDIVGDEWTTQPDDSGIQSMNVIFGGHIPNCFSQAVKVVSDSVERIRISGDKKSIVKSISDMPIEDRVDIASQRIAQYPHPVSQMHGELIPDCEADEGYEIAFWGTNDDMPDTIKRESMDAYIRFRLAGVHELIHHGDHIANVDKKRSLWLRRYGATLGYNGYYLKDYIDESLLTEVRQCNPAEMLYVGFMDLDSLTFDEGRAEEKPEFVANVVKAAIANGDLTIDQAKAIQTHALLLSHNEPAFLNRWQQVFAYLQG